jgi:hypothetical protein
MEDDNGMIILIFHVVLLSVFDLNRKLVLQLLVNWEAGTLFGSQGAG